MLARLMEFTNVLGPVLEEGSVSRETWSEATKTLLLLMAPSAPHIAEELWERLGLAYSIHNQQWPEYNADLVAEEQIVVAVQVNGKLRDKLTVPADVAEDEVTALALASEKVKAHTDGKTIKKVIYVPGKIVSVVVA